MIVRLLWVLSACLWLTVRLRAAPSPADPATQAQATPSQTLDDYVTQYVPQEVIDKLVTDGLRVRWKPIKAKEYTAEDSTMTLTADFKEVRLNPGPVCMYAEQKMALDSSRPHSIHPHLRCCVCTVLRGGVTSTACGWLVGWSLASICVVATLKCVDDSPPDLFKTTALSSRLLAPSPLSLSCRSSSALSPTPRLKPVVLFLDTVRPCMPVCVGGASCINPSRKSSLRRSTMRSWDRRAS